MPKLGYKNKWEKSGITLFNGNCFDILPTLGKRFDLVLTDPPYGTTACSWDTELDLQRMWECLKEVGKEDAAYVFTSSQPFTSKLVISNLKWFKYEWVWNKKKGGNPLLAKVQPIKVTENILVFGQKKVKYNPIMTEREKPKRRGKNRGIRSETTNNVFTEDKIYTQKYPKNIIEVSNASQYNRLHPTQKPVALMEYLIRTYTDEDALILDPFMGSGSTIVAANNLNRRVIGIEQEEKYYTELINRITTQIQRG